MRALIRLDSSLGIGTGHLMRCLTLAEWLRRSAVSVGFVCRALPGHMMTLIEARGHALHTLQLGDARDQIEGILPDWQEDAVGTANWAMTQGKVDWLIVDHYGLDYRWQRAIRAVAGRIMVIDDLANRAHDCDLLLDQNFYHDADTRYSKLLPKNAQALLGPRYALLRADFEKYRRQGRSRSGHVRNILVFLGGTDPDNVTGKVIRVLRSLQDDALDFHVVVGGSNPHRTRIEDACREDRRFHYCCQAENMAELMANADLAIGAGGATAWERCFLGLPAIVVATAPNQVRTTSDLASNGVCWYLGSAHELAETKLLASVTYALQNPGTLKAMSDRAMAVAGEDDALPTDRVARSMLSASLQPS